MDCDFFALCAKRFRECLCVFLSVLEQIKKNIKKIMSHCAIAMFFFCVFYHGTQTRPKGDSLTNKYHQVDQNSLLT